MCWPRHISHGVSRVYERHFLRSLRRKAMAKLAHYPDLCSPERVAAARTLLDFDDAVTAPVHGFASADDYYDRSSSLRFLHGVRRPTLLLSAADDPFLPPAVLDALWRGLRERDVDADGAVGPVQGEQRPREAGMPRRGDLSASMIREHRWTRASSIPSSVPLTLR